MLERKLVAYCLVGVAILGFIVLQISDAKIIAAVASLRTAHSPDHADVVGSPALFRKSAPLAPAKNGAIVFTLRPTGFEPSEINVPEGRYLLVVENRTGMPEVNLQLYRQPGQKQKEARLIRGKSVWKSVVELNAGRYVITEAGHPEWVCHVVVRK